MEDVKDNGCKLSFKVVAPWWSTPYMHIMALISSVGFNVDCEAVGKRVADNTKLTLIK